MDFEAGSGSDRGYGTDTDGSQSSSDGGHDSSSSSEVQVGKDEPFIKSVLSELSSCEQALSGLGLNVGQLQGLQHAQQGLQHAQQSLQQLQQGPFTVQSVLQGVPFQQFQQGCPSQQLQQFNTGNGGVNVLFNSDVGVSDGGQGQGGVHDGGGGDGGAGGDNGDDGGHYINGDSYSDGGSSPCLGRLGRAANSVMNGMGAMAGGVATGVTAAARVGVGVLNMVDRVASIASFLE